MIKEKATGVNEESFPLSYLQVAAAKKGTPILLVASEKWSFYKCYKVPQVLCPAPALIICTLWAGLPSAGPPAMAKEVLKWQESIPPNIM